VLLDQKRTKRMVQIVAILTSLAFGGVILVVMGLIFFGGGGQTQADILLDEAKTRVENEPRSADAWEQLASAYAGTEEFDQAIEAAQRAVALEPGNFRRLQTLVSLQVRQNDTAGAIAVLQEYTTRNPRNGEAFLQLGQLAEQDGRTPLARLSYQAFLRLEPDDPNADLIQQRLDDL
jgi:cytochrome c-type biogenesis protein CcmH/NrfG